jgi:hypothetical protein
MPDLQVQLRIQPPAYTLQNIALYPPVAAGLRCNTYIYNELNDIWALASLVDQDHRVMEVQLSGNLSDSAHPTGLRDLSLDQAYFFFPNLMIPIQGKYRIRITVMRMSMGQTLADSVHFVESRSITVEDSKRSSAKPSKWFEDEYF